MSESNNIIVAQHTERNYPGILLQGDTLKIIYDELIEITDNAKKLQQQDVIEGLEYLIEKFTDYLVEYEKVLEEKKIKLPYYMPVKTL